MTSFQCPALWRTRFSSVNCQYDRAIEQLRKTLELDPNYTSAHHYLGQTYAEKGMYEEAIEELSRARDAQALERLVHSVGSVDCPAAGRISGGKPSARIAAYASLLELK